MVRFSVDEEVRLLRAFSFVGPNWRSPFNRFYLAHLASPFPQPRLQLITKNSHLSGRWRDYPGAHERRDQQKRPFIGRAREDDSVRLAGIPHGTRDGYPPEFVADLAGRTRLSPRNSSVTRSERPSSSIWKHSSPDRRSVSGDG